MPLVHIQAYTKTIYQAHLIHLNVAIHTGTGDSKSYTFANNGQFSTSPR